MTRITVAVIGCGGMGQTHLRSLLHHPRCGAGHVLAHIDAGERIPFEIADGKLTFQAALRSSHGLRATWKHLREVHRRPRPG